MISAIVASTSFGGIGNRGTLPWPVHKEDMAWFRKHTLGNVVVMGRTTWDDPKCPNPFPDRINVVATNRFLTDPLSAKRISGDIAEEVVSLQNTFPDKNIFVIGGKEIFEQCQHVVQRVYLTRMNGNWFADTKINLDQWLSMFQLKSVKPGTDCTYEIWDRIFF